LQKDFHHRDSKQGFRFNMLNVVDGRGQHAFVNRGEMLFQVPEITGMLMEGKMSLGVLTIERTPVTRIKIASTIKV